MAAIIVALHTPGMGDAVLSEFAHRLAVGLAAIVAVVDPGLIVPAGEPTGNAVEPVTITFWQPGALVLSAFDEVVSYGPDR